MTGIPQASHFPVIGQEEYLSPCADDVTTRSFPRLTNYFVSKLDKYAVKTYQAVSADPSDGVLYYIIDELGDSRWAEKIRTSFSVRRLKTCELTEGVPAATALVYRWTCRVCKSLMFQYMLQKYSPLFQVSRSRLEVALKKVVASAIRDDVNLIGFGQGLFPNGKNIFLVRQKALLESAGESVLLVSLRGWDSDSIRVLLFASWRILYQSLRLRATRKSVGSNKRWIIFEQKYPNQPENPGFLPFYRYFKDRDDVLYAGVDEGSWMQEFLNSESKPTVSGDRWPLQSLTARFQALAFLGRYWSRTLWGREPLVVKSMVLLLKLKETYYELLVGAYPCKFYLRIRADYDEDHPIVTGVVEKCGGYHIGYQHGNYHALEEMFAFISFHAYGIWGKSFKDVAYLEAWPDNIPYPVIGPFTVAPCNGSRIQATPRKLTVAIFTTSVSSLLGNSVSDHFEFLEVCYSVLAAYDATLIVKEKLWEEQTEAIERQLRQRYGLTVTKVFNSAPASPDLVEGSDYCVARSEEIIAASDLVVTAHHSTVAWEALSLKKKILVFCNPAIRHHFEAFGPRLVVRNRHDFEKQIRWLLSVSQSDYEDLVAPLIREWCKENNGDLVRSFWEEIEGLLDVDRGELSVFAN